MKQPKGFGNKYNAEIAAVVKGCRKRSPEDLDLVFDRALTMGEEERGSYSDLLIDRTVEKLEDDHESLYWFCGYMCSEINKSGDEPKAIVALCRTLGNHGLKAFKDYIPYPKEQIAVSEEVFEKLPDKVKKEILKVSTVSEKPSDEFIKDVLSRVNEFI